MRILYHEMSFPVPCQHTHTHQFLLLVPMYLQLSVINIKFRDVTLRAGCAIAQAVSRRLPTAAARVQNRVWSCGML
jgi:hypothetical protein